MTAEISLADDEHMLVGEIVERYRISRSKVYELMQARELSFVAIGRSRRVPKRAIEDFLRQKLVRAVGETSA
jgi:excisionase family DNA binding protein